MQKKGFFSSHAKSSAALISLGIHAVFVVIALSFVAVTVITKDEQAFKAKPVKRPKMALKKLQVPVKMKPKRPRPKLRKRIVVQPKINQTMPDIQMPELAGVKGGLGGGIAGGIGGAGGIGFSMPEIEIFGVKGKGEKIFIILDASGYMMVDEMGGIPAYTIIKAELVRILEGLNPTVLFNIAVYGGGNYTLFPSLVPASEANVAKVEQWLAPLNEVKKGMGDTDYGAKTLGPGGMPIQVATHVEPLKGEVGFWAGPTMLAMEQQSDAVFLLTCTWGWLAYQVADTKPWGESKMERWKHMVEKAREKHRQENEQRRKRGEPPRVVMGGDRGLVGTYIPGEPHPPLPEFKGYVPKEMFKAFNTKRAMHKPPESAQKSGLSRKKDRFSLNVIHFTPARGTVRNEAFYKLTSLARGKYRMIKGLDAIESYVSIVDARLPSP